MRTISLVITLVFSLAISASDVWVVSVKTPVASCWVVTQKTVKDCACSPQCVCGCNDGKKCDCGKVKVSPSIESYTFTSEPVCIGGT